MDRAPARPGPPCAATPPRQPGTPVDRRDASQLKSEDGKARYAKRRETAEPVFGQIKDVRGASRLLRRGLHACDAEWKLLCGAHNLLKLWRHTITQQAARPATA